MDFIRRHKRKFYVTAGLGAIAYGTTIYIKNQLLDYLERARLEREARDRLERRFEQNQRDATFTILALLPQLGDRILAAYDVEAIKKELQGLRTQSRTQQDLASSSNSEQMASSLTASGMLPEQTGSHSQTTSDNTESGELDKSYVKPASKSELWNQIKLQSLTRAITIVYGMALLVLLTRIQLNILGRRTYIAAMANLGASQNAVDKSGELEQVHRHYLTFSWWLINRGWEPLGRRVMAAVEAATADIDPLTELTYADLNSLFGAIQYNVDHSNVAAPVTLQNLPTSSEGPSGATFISTLLPPRELETYVLSHAPSGLAPPLDVNSELRDLLDETADLIESPNASNLIGRLVRAGLTVLVAKLEPSFSGENQPAKLAHILAGVTKQAPQMAAGHPMTNDYIDALVDEPQLDAFSALIYSNYE